MIKDLFTTLMFVLLGTIVLSSCSSNEEEVGSKGNFTIDGEPYRVELASCSNGIQEEYADAGCFFEAELYGDEDIYSFTVELVRKYHLDDIESGEDVTDITGVYSFHRITNVDFSRFEETDGRVIVKSVNSKKIVLEFKNFTFNRYDSNYSYVVNGTIEYDRR